MRNKQQHIIFKAAKQVIRNFVLRELFVLTLLVVSFSGYSTNYFVSSSQGNDKNPGTSPASAWQTLEKVQNFKPIPGDSIFFKRDDFWEGTLSIKSSGTENNNIYYGAFGSGEKPIIYGSEEIANWTKYSGNIYKANFSKNIYQLFINDDRLQVARYPNTGFFKISSVSGSTRFTSSNLSSAISYNKAVVHIKTNEWRLDNKDVIVSSGRQLTIDSKTSYGLKSGQSFFLCNKLEFLDKPGQWFYDTNTKTVYVWTPNGDSPDNYSIRGSVFKNGVEVILKQDVTVQNFQLLQHSERGIYIEKSNSITIANNEIRDIEYKGISAKGQAIKLINNLVEGSNQFAITLGGSNSEVTDNICKNTALLNNLGIKGMNGFSYVMAVGGDNNFVGYNKIINSGYTGISWTGKNCLIAYNYAENLMQVLSDGGAIYTYSRNVSNPIVFGSVIKNNIIRNLQKGTAGIYMDERTRDVVIENNTIAHCKGYAIFYHDNKNIEARNNTLFDNGKGMRATGTFGGNKFFKNVVCNIESTKDGKYPPSLVLLHPDEQTLALDSNLYIERYYKYPFRNTKTYNYQSFEGWKNTMKQDANSVYESSPLKSGEKEELFFNASKTIKNINLGTTVYRKIKGERITGSINLQPFTSVILIKTNETVKGNQPPIIKDQSFQIPGDKNPNDFIGQIIATDPDTSQILSYSIIAGNNDNLFSIDTKTGELFANTELVSKQNTSVILTIEVIDNSGSPLASTANVTVNIVGVKNIDTILPVISDFSLPDSSRELTVPVLSFIATDNIGVTSYILTESSENISADNKGWLNNAPDSFTFKNKGVNTLYAWVKDAQGNISEIAAAKVAILLPKVVFNEFLSICEGDNYRGWKTSGNYSRTIKSTSGPDTIIYTSLNVVPAFSIVEDITIKPGENYLGWTNEGIYNRTLTSSFGCDSIVTTNLRIMQPVYVNEEVSICEGESYFGWNTNGTFERTLTANSGADSIVSTKLTIHPNYYTSENITIYQGESYEGWTTQGTYTRTLIATTGCDSIIETFLSVLPKIEIDSISFPTIFPFEDPTSFFFGFDNNQSLVNFPENESNDITVYPNPAKTHIFVAYQHTPKPDTFIQLIDNNGKIIITKNVNSDINRLNTNSLHNGLYYVRSINGNRINVKKVMIE